MMYVDESGDIGLRNSPSNYFVLSALVLHENNWLNVLDDLIVFRRALKSRFGLLMKEEIHASEFITGRPKLSTTIPRNDRLDLLKKCLVWLNSRNDVSIVSVRCKKTGRDNDIFDFTWRTLIQRFENTLAHNNFPNGFGNDKGILISDNTDGGKLTRLLREMRRFNPVPNTVNYGPGARNMRLRAAIEDPVMRDSANSYFHQMVDVVAYFARQFYEPNKYVRKKGARTFYANLSDVINPHVTRYKTPNNIVEI